ncbi:MAG: hypothetical protein QOF11_1864 [Chloroflexota bacterium]|jgi:hypothetical protein|nr:hypothetical protein [Chloroflexota bacterium]
MTRIHVACDPVAPGWSCQVRVVEANSATSHRVSVATADLERLDPGAADPTDLVRRSFEFLLEREPKESILRTFDLMVIGRYFPDWEQRLRR